MPLNSSTLTQDLLKITDTCVQCGLCSPHCPTYRLSEDENESPRGRLMLGKAVLKGDLTLTPRIQNHIDSCLQCRSCERVCPSGVKFGEYMNGLRQTLAQTNQKSLPATTTAYVELLSSHHKTKQLNKWLWLAQRTGLRYLGEKFLLGKHKRLLQSLPTIQRSKTLKTHYPPVGKETQRVMLFSGCTDDLFGQQIIDTAIKVLNLLGVHVEVPNQQRCCGGLSLHSGDYSQAEILNTQNTAAFASNESLPIITLVSGCASSLIDINKQFANRVIDISHFLTQLDWPETVNLAPLPQTIAVHSPCSLRNSLRQHESVHKLLSRIPELNLQRLPDSLSCCGAAGTYMLDHPQQSAELRQQTLATLNDEVRLLLTSNIGCSMHLQAGLKQAGRPVKLMHPIELIAQQLSLIN